MIDTTTAPAAATLRITPDLVQAFAHLTGDRSSLHMDEAFAARSAYRRRVAHGFLPVLSLAAAMPPPFAGVPIRVERVAAQFVGPVFVDDRLRVDCQAAAAADGATDLAYTFSRDDDGRVVTTVRMTVRGAAAAAAALPSAGVEATGCIVAEPLDEAHLRLDQIAKGEGAGLTLRVTSAALDRCRVLAAAACNVDPAVVSDAPDLLAACGISTLAGMRLPGRSATLLDATLAFEQPIVIDRDHRLAATIRHKSESTGVISARLSVSDGTGGAAEASGQYTARVNEPPARGPSMQELREHGIADLGLRGKVVLITGASRGIGETTAKLFALHGAKVIVNYLRSAEDAARVVDEIGAGGGEACAVQADVSNREDVRRLAGEAQRRFGSIHVLVNNAVGDFHPIPFGELRWESMQRDLDVIVKGAFNCCQEVVPQMIAAGAGKILNVSSVAVDDPPPGQTKYVVAKSALLGLTRSLAVELAPHNIQVNMVAASMVETDLVRHVPRVFVAGMRNDAPMKRLASTVDVAASIVLLASSLAPFTTGQRLVIGGGRPPFL